ncbi:hypothetical protein [Neisseria bacilliformis]|uniref:hypothetical protein n=1 Tax=Neisseria bacilliformis TaxID=267212 RepID=UPI0028EA8B97|nr:hypothetical protein [Neisseria bacilliformis]
MQADNGVFFNHGCLSEQELESGHCNIMAAARPVYLPRAACLRDLAAAVCARRFSDGRQENVAFLPPKRRRDRRRQSALGRHIGAMQDNNKPLNLNKRSDYCAGRREKVFCRRKNRASYPGAAAAHCDSNQGANLILGVRMGIIAVFSTSKSP